MDDPKIIDSPLSRRVEKDGTSVKIAIYRLEDTKWSLEIIAEDGCSTIWEDPFETDEEALAEAVQAIEADGIASFSEQPEPPRTVH